MNHFKFQKHKIMKFLLPISLLSAFFSILLLLHQSLKPFLTMLLVDKCYVFLLCNGLVVFILKNSGLIDVRNTMEIQNNARAEEEEEEEEPEGGISSDAQEDEEEQRNDALVAIDEDEEHGDEAEDVEELNKKFEDFIRKTKETFCSEPRAYFNSDEFEAQDAVE